MTYEICWQEYTNAGNIVIKRKSFKTEEARARFVEKLFKKDNFHQILAYSD